MKQKMIWGITTLIVLLLGVNAFLLLRNTDTEPTQPKVIVNDVTPEQLENIRKHVHSQIKSTQKPPDEPGFEWVWHHNHWDKVPIVQKPEMPIVSNEMQKYEPVQVETVVIKDWEKYLTFFESKDPDEMSLADFVKCQEVWSQYMNSVRGFNYDRASEDVRKLHSDINHAFRALIRGNANQLKRLKAESDKRGTPEPMIFGPVAGDEGGEE